MNPVLMIPSDNRKLFYSGNEREAECIGHLRGDFGKCGTEFWTSWWPHGADKHNSPAFRAEFQGFVNALRKSLLKDRNSMRRYLLKNPSIIAVSGHTEHHGYRIQTEQHEYYIRCNPDVGDYNFYIYCYLHEKEVAT